MQRHVLCTKNLFHSPVCGGKFGGGVCSKAELQCMAGALVLGDCRGVGKGQGYTGIALGGWLEIGPHRASSCALLSDCEGLQLRIRPLDVETARTPTPPLSPRPHVSLPAGGSSRVAVISLDAMPCLRCDRATASDVMCPCMPSVGSSSLKLMAGNCHHRKVVSKIAAAAQPPCCQCGNQPRCTILQLTWQSLSEARWPLEGEEGGRWKGGPTPMPSPLAIPHPTHHLAPTQALRLTS